MILEKQISGSNQNLESFDYDHPGGMLVIAVSNRSAGSITVTYDEVSMSAVETLTQGDVTHTLFTLAEAPVGEHEVAITVSSAVQLASLCFSINGSLRDSNSSAVTLHDAGDIDVAVTSEDTDLVLGFLSWRNSAANASFPSPQVTELTDTSPTRCGACSRAGQSSSTTIEADLTDGSDQNDIVLIAASFIPDEDQFTLTIHVTGEGSANPNPAQAEYDENDEVQLTAFPDPGWTFLHWEGDLQGFEDPETLKPFTT